MDSFKCLRCGHEWYPRSEKKPVQCPYCKNPKWDKPKNKKAIANPIKNVEV